MENIVNWVYGVIANPVSTLKEISAEKPVGLAIFITAFISLLVGISTINADDMADLREFGVPDLAISLPVVIILLVLLGVAGVFIAAGVLHLVSRLLYKADGDYWSLFSVLGFANIPAVFIPVFMLITTPLGSIMATIIGGLFQLLIGIWTVVLEIIGLRETYGLTTGQSVISYLLLVFLYIAFFIAIVIFFVIMAFIIGVM